MTDQPHDNATAVRLDERRACWDAINLWIRTGPLSDEQHAMRNGMINACNLIRERGDWNSKFEGASQGMEQVKTLEQLAIDDFEARERVAVLNLMNTPTGYEDRKKLHVERAVAQAAMIAAGAALDKAIRGTK